MSQLYDFMRTINEDIYKLYKQFSKEISFEDGMKIDYSDWKICILRELHKA